MIELLYATGLRVSELVSLRLAQLRLDQGLLVAFGKGSKERIVPVGESAERWLGEYFRRARPALERGRSDAVFLSRLGAAMTRQAFWQALKRHARSARGCGTSRPTCSATASPPTCSSTAPTCAPSR